MAFVNFGAPLRTVSVPEAVPFTPVHRSMQKGGEAMAINKASPESMVAVSQSL